MQKEKKRAHPSITPRSNPRHCASGDTPRGGPIAPSCALRAHARENAAAAPRAQSPEPAPGTGRRLFLRPAGAPTTDALCLCSSCVATGTARSQLGGSWRCPRVGSESVHASGARVRVTDHAQSGSVWGRRPGQGGSSELRCRGARPRRHVQKLTCPTYSHRFAPRRCRVGGERGGWRICGRTLALLLRRHGELSLRRARVRAHGVH